jgi:Domain of unknown function (DUF4280)
MSEKHVVVQGATCKCQFGSTTDKLKVSSHQKEYANDEEGTQKLIVTTKELGATFYSNSFGVCTKMGGTPPPCKPMVTEWTNFYEKLTLSNGGQIVLEDSKASCAIAGMPCIEIINHGQVAEPRAQNFENEDKDVQNQIMPVSIKNSESKRNY